MIKDIAEKIQDAINEIKAIQSEEKKDLLVLLDELKMEITHFSKSHQEHAQSVAHYAETAAHEAARSKKSPRLLEHSLKGLALSVDGFETSHPKLVELVNDICTALARIGI